MGTILDNKRAELNARVMLKQEEIKQIKATAQKEMEAIKVKMLADVQKCEAESRRWEEQLRELQDFEPAIDPNDRNDPGE